MTKTSDYLGPVSPILARSQASLWRQWPHSQRVFVASWMM